MSLWQVQCVALCPACIHCMEATRHDLTWIEHCCLDVYQSLLRPSQQGSCGPTPRDRTSAEWQRRIGAQTTSCHASLTPVIESNNILDVKT
jgi:hypothetical protein